MISVTQLVLLILIPQAMSFAAALIFLRRTRTVGTVLFLTGFIISLVACASVILFPYWNQHYGLTATSSVVWWTFRTGFSYLGVNLYAIGLLTIALQSRKVAQQSAAPAPAPPPHTRSGHSEGEH